MQTQGWWDTGRELNQRIIHQWSTRLQRNSHTHAIDLKEDIIRQIAFEVQVLLLIQGIVAATVGQDSQDTRIDSGNTLILRDRQQLVQGVITPEGLPARVLQGRRQRGDLQEAARHIAQTLFLSGRGNTCCQGTELVAHRTGQMVDGTGGKLLGAIPVVACEKLIACIAGESHSDMLARHTRDEVGRQRGGIGKGLVQKVSDRLNKIIGLGLKNLDVMLGVKVVRDNLRIVQLAEGFLLKANTEGLGLLSADLSGQSQQAAGIEAAAQEEAQGYITDQATFDGLPEQLTQLMRVIVDGAARSFAGLEAHIPILMRAPIGRLATLIGPIEMDLQVMACR